MTVSLTEDLERFVERKVASGRYGSSSEVVREALRLMETIEQADAETRASLRKAWQDGVASGDAGEMDFGTLKTEARARLAALKA